MLSDFVVIWDVDANRNATRGKGKYLKTGEVRLFKLFALELCTPRQIFQGGLGSSDKVVEEL